jgi:hypothetical protein
MDRPVGLLLPFPGLSLFRQFRRRVSLPPRHACCSEWMLTIRPRSGPLHQPVEGLQARTSGMSSISQIVPPHKHIHKT